MNWNALWFILPISFIVILLFFLFRRFKQRQRSSLLPLLSPAKSTNIENFKLETSNIHNSVKQTASLKGPYNWLDSDIYFADCIARTFPGDRGIVWYNKPHEAVKRLKLFFDNYHQNHPNGDAIWWKRGNYDFSVANAEILDSNKILLDNDRFQITRIAVCVTEYYKQYIYVEAAPEPSVCTPPTIVSDESKQLRGFCYEEYAEFQNHIISRQEYDDGAAVLGEKVVQLNGQAKYRVRYLTKVNFVLVAKNSAYNNPKFYRDSGKLFNEALESEESVKKIFEFMATFKKTDKPQM